MSHSNGVYCTNNFFEYDIYFSQGQTNLLQAQQNQQQQIVLNATKQQGLPITVTQYQIVNQPSPLPAGSSNFPTPDRKHITD